MTTPLTDFYSGPEIWKLTYQVDGDIEVQERVGFKTLKAALIEMGKLERKHYPSGIIAVELERVWVQMLPKPTQEEIDYLNQRFDLAMADPKK